MESDEAILRVQNLFERLMDAEKQLVQVGGLIQGVDDIGDDLALFLHALQVGDIEKADDDGLDAGVAQMVLGRNFKPTPQTVFALEAAAGVEPGARRFTQFLNTRVRARLLVRVQQVDDGFSDQIARKNNRERGQILHSHREPNRRCRGEQGVRGSIPATKRVARDLA